jgi:Ca2+-binding EF-hand superfamily protein
MTQSINYQITKEEIVEMFQMFDVNKNGRLEIGELEERVRDCRLG